jgi:hypothetical protein
MPTADQYAILSDPRACRAWATKQAVRDVFVAAWNASPTAAAFMARTGLTRWQAYSRAQRLRRLGLPVKKMPTAGWPVLTREDLEAVAPLLSGPTQMAALKLGTSRYTLRRLRKKCRDAGVAIPPYRHPTVVKVEELVRRGYSQTEVARRVGRSRQRVHQIVSRAGEEVCEP